MIDAGRGDGACVATLPREITATRRPLDREEAGIPGVISRGDAARARTPLHRRGDGPHVDPVTVPFDQLQDSLNDLVGEQVWVQSQVEQFGVGRVEVVLFVLHPGIGQTFGDVDPCRADLFDPRGHVPHGEGLGGIG